MEQEWCNSKGDKLYKQFKDIAGEKAVSILNAIWQDWRKERMKADAKEKADEVLRRVRKRHIRQSMKKRKGTIQAVFDVGYGLYDKKRLADFQNGAECAFMYGYLCALEDQEKQQSIAE